MMKTRGVCVIALLAFAACKSQSAPSPAPGPSASASASSGWGWAATLEPSSTASCKDPGLLDAPLMKRMDADPAGAAKALEEKYASDDACARLLVEIARYAAAKPKKSFPEWAEERGLPGKNPSVEQASFELARRALDLGDPGVNAAVVLYSVWLLPRPKWGTLDANARKLAAELVAADISQVHSTEPMVIATLERDPEAVEVFRAFMGSYLGEGIVERLREMQKWPRPPSWIPTIARELPQHTTLGELENPTQREVIVKAMNELGGVDRGAANRALDEAHRRIRPDAGKPKK